MLNNHSNIDIDSIFTFEWNKENISNFERRFCELNSEVKKTTKQPNMKKEWFKPELPKNDDVLFWHLYIMINDITVFEFFKNKLEIRQKLSFEWIEKMKEEYKEWKAILKRYHLSIDDCINDLASSKSITIETFICVCIVLKLPVCLKDDKILHNYSQNNEESYLLNFKTNERKIDKVNTMKLCMDHIIAKYIDKPFLSKASYKRDEILKISDILEIDEYDSNKKRKTKDKLWDEIMVLYS